MNASVAFDTQTGQICRTWDWQPIGAPSKTDPVSGNTPQRSFGEFAPTCLSLYKDFPSTSSTNTAVISDESASAEGS
jgi:hypothetical protein